MPCGVCPGHDAISEQVMQDGPKMAEVDFKTATSTMEALARISVSSSVYVGEITASLGCPLQEALRTVCSLHPDEKGWMLSCIHPVENHPASILFLGAIEVMKSSFTLPGTGKAHVRFIWLHIKSLSHGIAATSSALVRKEK